jgi:hypothetical protein
LFGGFLSAAIAETAAGAGRSAAEASVADREISRQTRIATIEVAEEA